MKLSVEIETGKMKTVLHAAFFLSRVVKQLASPGVSENVREFGNHEGPVNDDCGNVIGKYRIEK